MNFKKVKSWHIVLAGTFVKFLLSVREAVTSEYLCTVSYFVTHCKPLSSYSTLEAVGGILSLFPLSWLILVALLYLDKARKMTGIIILFGVIFAFYSESILLVIFLVLAGTFSDIKQIISNMKREGIKSWHFGLISIILMLLSANLSIRGPNSAMVSILFIFLFPIWVMPTLLLYFEKTRKLGAATAIIMGLLITFFSESGLGLIPYSMDTPAYDDGIKKLAIVPALVTPTGIFLILAGILHFATGLKSWYIAATGVLIQILSGWNQFYSWRGVQYAKHASEDGILVMLAALIGFAPAILLYFDKTRKRGAVLSVIFGVISLAIIIAVLNAGGAPRTDGYILEITSIPRDDVVPVIMGIVTGSFLLLAGLLHLKEKI